MLLKKFIKCKFPQAAQKLLLDFQSYVPRCIKVIFCTLVCLEGAKQFLDSNKNMEFRQDVFFACQKIGIYFFACFFELKQAGQKKPCILPCKIKNAGRRLRVNLFCSPRIDIYCVLSFKTLCRIFVCRQKEDGQEYKGNYNTSHIGNGKSCGSTGT